MLKKVDIGIIGALEEEVHSLISDLEDAETLTVGGVKMHIGSLEGRRVAIMRCGVGKVFAAVAAEALVIATSPSLLVNTGVGGALARGLKTGDIVIADKLVQHDMDTSAIGDPVGLVSGINKVYFEADERAVKVLSEGASALGLNSRVATVASGDKFIADKGEKERIVSLFGASVCEMEGAAIAHAAYLSETPAVVIRAISDSADEGATMDYLEFLPIAAKNSAALTRYLIKNY